MSEGGGGGGGQKFRSFKLLKPSYFTEGREGPYQYSKWATTLTDR